MTIVVTSRSGSPVSGIQQDLDAIDQALRQSFAGFEHDAIVTEVRQSLEHVELNLTDESVDAYADAIRTRVDFELSVD